MTEISPFISTHSVEKLYLVGSYTDWSRRLHRLMPLPQGSRLLFDSTIEEPADLLASVVATAFAKGPSDRYESVFGSGNRHLVAAIAARYGVQVVNVRATTGVVVGLRQVLATLVGPGDEVLIETPAFDVLEAMSRFAGARVAPLQRPFPGFDLTPDMLEAAIGPDTRMVVISNLHNPSGVMLSEARILELAAVAARHDAVLVVDEVYADMARPAGTPLPLAPNLIRLNSLSKVLGLHALRCGWIIAEQAMLARIVAANSAREFGVSKLSHAVAALVMENIEPFEQHSQDMLSRGRPVLEHHLEAMRADGLIEGELAHHACMAFPRLTQHRDTMVLAERLWQSHGLVTAPGEKFGLAGHMRLGVAGTEADLDDGLSRLHKALKSI